MTGFGLLGHASKLARASRLTAAIDAARVPYLPGAREALRDGYVSGGSRRNLEWVTPWTDFGAADEAERLLLADAQTSGGLLVAGELPGRTGGRRAAAPGRAPGRPALTGRAGDVDRRLWTSDARPRWCGSAHHTR